MASRRLSFLISTFITVRPGSVSCLSGHSDTKRYSGYIGNGTQAIAWQINEETYRQTLESEGGSPNAATGPHVFYGSIHDILSYPCEVRIMFITRLCMLINSDNTGRKAGARPSCVGLATWRTWAVYRECPSWGLRNGRRLLGAVRKSLQGCATESRRVPSEEYAGRGFDIHEVCLRVHYFQPIITKLFAKQYGIRCL